MTPTTTITVQRATRTSDGAGGKVENWAPVYTDVAASIRYFTHMGTLVRNETPAGVTEDELRLIVMYGKPFPTILPNDIVEDADGRQYLVLHSKTYAQSLQLRARVLTFA